MILSICCNKLIAFYSLDHHPALALSRSDASVGAAGKYQACFCPHSKGGNTIGVEEMVFDPAGFYGWPALV